MHDTIHREALSRVPAGRRRCPDRARELAAPFGKRTAVTSSNDHHANQQVNYLLQRLESFSGICILSTNNDAALDEAFRRRLVIHIRFSIFGTDEEGHRNSVAEAYENLEAHHGDHRAEKPKFGVTLPIESPYLEPELALERSDKFWGPTETIVDHLHTPRAPVPNAPAQPSQPTPVKPNWDTLPSAFRTVKP